MLVALMVHAMWLMRLVNLRLHRRYVALTSYLVLSFGLAVTGLLLSTSHMKLWDRPAYLWFFLASRPIIWLLFFAVLFECYSRLVEGYEGVRRLGRLVLIGAAGSVVLLMAVIALVNPYDRPEANLWSRVILIQEQSVYFATSIAVAGLLAMRRFFELSVVRNVRIVFTAFGAYFSGMVALIVLRSLGGAELAALVDVGGNCLYVVCLATGAYWFSASGEHEVEDPRVAERAEHAAALRAAYGRLEHLDGELLRTLAR